MPNVLPHSLLKTALVAGLSLAAGISVAQTNYRIGVSTGSFMPEQTTVGQAEPGKTPLFAGRYFRLVQFYHLPSDAEKAAWKQQGLLLTDYLPTNCYYAVVAAGFDWAAIRGKVRTVVVPDERLKLEAPLFFQQQALRAGNAPSRRTTSSGLLRLTVSFYAGLDYNAVASDLKSRGAVLGAYRDYSRQVDVELPATGLAQLVAAPYVQFIGEQEGERINEAGNLSYRNTSGRANYLNTGQNGLLFNGYGVKIAIGETGTVGNGADFKGRLSERQTGGLVAHKVGTTQCAGGAGNLNPVNRNDAWGAWLVSFDSQSYTSLITADTVRYFNHSYGVGIYGSYDSQARDHDLRTAAYPNHLVSYSSGNDGTLTGYAPYNTFSGWGNITGALKQNKNHLAVANLGQNDVTYLWGCSGPTYDGRIMPQLTIEGEEGTSYASPKVVGILAMLEQAWKGLHGGQQSNSSLLKGIVLNTADDMGNPGPDFRAGYGRPNVRRAYNLITANQIITGTVANGGSNTHPIAVPAGVKQVRALLIWQDVAAAVNANPCIVNNLDLSAASPTAVTYNPWVLDASPDPARLNLPATRGVDNINTVEQITVDAPASGNWVFSVAGTAVPAGPQQYYLVYEFLYDELKMAYPLSGEKLVTGDFYHLRWDSYGGKGKFALDYRLAGGSWMNIAGGLADSVRQYEWLAPSGQGVQPIEFRVQRGALTDQSGVNYLARQVASLRVGRVCRDTVVLKWAVLPNATGYQVYRLGDKYMLPVTANITFNGTSATLIGQSRTADELYAVSAVSGPYEGQRTTALVRAPGDVNCRTVNWTGTVSTNWFDAANWATPALPTAADNVRILASAPFQPVIAGNGAVCNDLLIQAGASLGMSGATAYRFNVQGDWVNDGTFNAGIGLVNFNDGANYQEITGASATAFYQLRVGKGAQSNVLEANSPISLTAPVVSPLLVPLTISSGTFKLSSSSTLTPFATGADASLTSSSGIWNNGGTINYGNFSWTTDGFFKISGGTTNVGTVPNVSITYTNNSKFIVEDGNLNIAGRIVPGSSTATGTYSQYGGNVTLNTAGSTSTTDALLRLNPGGTFFMAGGKLILQQASASTTADFINLATNSSVVGGTVQIGNALTPANQTLRLYTTSPIFNLTVNSTNNPVVSLVSANLKVLNDLELNGGGLNANGFDVAVGGDWHGNAALAAGTGEVVFSGSTMQTVDGTTTALFKDLTINNEEGVVVGKAAKVAGVLTFTKGLVYAADIANPLTIGATGTVSGASDASHVAGYVVKEGTGPFTYPVGDNSRYQKVDVDASANTGGIRAAYFAADAGPAGYGTTGASAVPLVAVNHREYWDITPLGTGTNTGSVTTYFDDYQNTGIGSTDDLRVAHLSGGSWLNEGGTGTGTTGAGSVTSNSVSNWSPFALGSVALASPLPVKLVSFTARESGSANIVRWKTADEEPGDLFVVERSLDGQSFRGLDQQAAVGGFTGSSYLYTDAQPLNGNTYYRLRVLQSNGKQYYSPVVYLYRGGRESTVLVAPNPFTDVVRVTIAGSLSSDATLSVTDVLGKLILTQPVRNNVQEVSLQHLVSGCYFIRFRDASRNEVVKIIK